LINNFLEPCCVCPTVRQPHVEDDPSHVWKLKGHAIIILLFVHIKFLVADLDPRNTVYPGWHTIVVTLAYLININSNLVS
jgi:hypothetical protein